MKEDKNEISFMDKTWSSESKFNNDWHKSFQNHQNMKNRLMILDSQKQKKMKDIEKKLEMHKRNVIIKIFKDKNRRAVEGKNRQEDQNVTMYSNHFQQQRKRRQKNIRKMQSQLLEEKKKDYSLVKEERLEIDRIIRQQKQKEHEEKKSKRNKVKMMEIECRQNVIKSWENKLQKFKEGRMKLVRKKLKEHEQNMLEIGRLEKEERKKLDQIINFQNKEYELVEVIEEEQMMGGAELRQLYQDKF